MALAGRAAPATATKPSAAKEGHARGLARPLVLGKLTAVAGIVESAVSEIHGAPKLARGAQRGEVRELAKGRRRPRSWGSRWSAAGAVARSRAEAAGEALNDDAQGPAPVVLQEAACGLALRRSGGP
eukprot:4302693-Alexandrium_andersonii.AAC.1